MVNVIIIGAGISGLAAAKYLQHEGIKVTVLEARDRVGGRTFTKRGDKIGYADLGGAYVGPSQRRVARMAKEYGLQFHKVNQKQKALLSVRGKRWKYHSGNQPPLRNIIPLIDLNYALQQLEKIGALIPKDKPWDATDAEYLDNTTVEEWLQKVAWTEFTKATVRLMVQNVYCVEASEISLLYFCWYMESGSMEAMIRVEDGAQESKFVGGSMQLSECMAKDIGLDNIHFNHPVIKIEQTNGEVFVTAANGNVFEADYVICTVPLAIINRIQFKPPLSPQLRALMQRVPMGSTIKTCMYYERQHWVDIGLNGEAAQDYGPVYYCVDDTKPDGSFPCIMGFILANRARTMVNKTAEERKIAVAKHYAEVFQCDKMLEPIHYEECNWMAEEYTGGCYTGCMTPGTLSTLGSALTAPHGRVLFAGTEHSVDWPGYMEGAIESGERSSREVLKELGQYSGELYVPEPPCDHYPEKSHYKQELIRGLPSVGQLVMIPAFLMALIAVGAAYYIKSSI